MLYMQTTYYDGDTPTHVVTLSERNVRMLADALDSGRDVEGFVMSKILAGGERLVVNIARDDRHYGADGRAV